MLSRFARLWRREPAAAAPVPAPAAPAPLPRFADDLASAGVSAADWCQRRREGGSLYSDLSDDAVRSIRGRWPARASDTLDAAERLLRHEFDLLGSGRFVPVDPDRQSTSGYRPIDWYLDPVRTLRFPRGIHYKKWNLYEMRPGNADVKYPWELGRCQHWATLGQAFRLTGDERFALEIAAELDDFVEANPVGIGVNWTCTMDVALRAVSWSIGLELIRSSRVPGDRFWERAYSALFDHGVFIINNLENTYEVTSNHFLSNVVGLQFAGAVFADLEQGQAWSAFARQALEQEMNVQVLSDGADYESSIPYHRLVAELFVGGARLADVEGRPLSPEYRERARRMVVYLAAVARPDGLMPQVGDADDGRLHVFGGYGTPQDGRHLMGPAAVMFDEPGWLATAGEGAGWEAAWWGLDADAVRAAPGPPASAWCVGLFREAGVAVARSVAGHYLLVTNGIVGTNGFGNHKHNDQLSFEYHHAACPLIVDPGSYVYTSDPAARNLFRGTFVHNTLSIDGAEQNDLRPDWLFRLFENARGETLVFDERDDEIEYRGRHHGYERLAQPVTHARTVRLAKASGGLTVLDRLSGAGEHDVRWHFHLAPGVDAVADAGGAILSARGSRWRLTVPGGLRVAIGPAAYSPSYGVKVPCLAIDVSSRLTIDGERSFEFSVSV